MKQFKRQPDGALLDRKTGRLIKIRDEHKIGNHLYINSNKSGSQVEWVICCDDVEETRR